MSLCDTCRAPGNCCKSMVINGGDRQSSEFKALTAGRASHTDALNFARKHGLPFVPHEAVSRGRGVWIWRFSCPRLTPEGRCGDYENRPQLCRDFKPGSDRLCVHYGEGVDDDVILKKSEAA